MAASPSKLGLVQQKAAGCERPGVKAQTEPVFGAKAVTHTAQVTRTRSAWPGCACDCRCVRRKALSRARGRRLSPSSQGPHTSNSHFIHAITVSCVKQVQEATQRSSLGGKTVVAALFLGRGQGWLWRVMWVSRLEGTKPHVP